MGGMDVQGRHRPGSPRSSFQTITLLFTVVTGSVCLNLVHRPGQRSERLPRSVFRSSRDDSVLKVGGRGRVSVSVSLHLEDGIRSGGEDGRYETLSPEVRISHLKAWTLDILGVGRASGQGSDCLP